MSKHAAVVSGARSSRCRSLSGVVVNLHERFGLRLGYLSNFLVPADQHIPIFFLYLFLFLKGNIA